VFISRAFDVLRRKAVKNLTLTQILELIACGKIRRMTDDEEKTYMNEGNGFIGDDGEGNPIFMDVDLHGPFPGSALSILHEDSEGTGMSLRLTFDWPPNKEMPKDQLDFWEKF